MLETITLDSIESGGLGVIIRGPAPYAQIGEDVSTAGDFNGDGIADFVFSGPYGDAPYNLRGITYIVYGKAGGVGAINPAAMTADQGFRIFGAQDYDKAGQSVTLAGDVNGDGFSDLLVGAPRSGAPGGAYIIFGKAGGYTDISLATLTPSTGFAITSGGDYGVGLAISSAGDFNGDGYDDFILGSPADPSGGNYAGRAYLIFGKPDMTGPISLASLSASEGFVIQGSGTDQFLGDKVSSLGDINGDGFDDVIVSAPNNATGGYDSGTSYVLFGKASGFGTINVASLSAQDGFAIIGRPNSWLSTVASGDINGDGYRDMIVGAPHRDGYAGTTYVIYGKASGLGTIDLANFSAAQGVVITGGLDDGEQGSEVSAGDINGDGFDDVIIGAPNSTPGAAYVIYGGAALASTINIDTADASAGMAFIGNYQGNYQWEFTGRAAAAAGDINSDGLIDLLIGAKSNHSGGQHSGTTYLVYGQLPTGAVSRIGTIANQSLVGGNSGDSLYGMGGDDRLYGHDGNDILDGGAGADTLNGGSGADAMDGGIGNDVYFVDDAGDTVTEASGAGLDTVRTSVTWAMAAGQEIEQLATTNASGTGAIDLNGNDLVNRIIGNEGDNRLYGMGGNDRLTGGGGRDVLDGGAGADVMAGGTGGDYYFVDNAGDVLIEAEADTSDIDSVLASVSYTLAAGVHVERIGATPGTTAIDLTGNEYSQRIQGNEGVNTLLGGDGVDALKGFGGDDVLNGGGGRDKLTGGLGADRFVFEQGGELDMITDFETGIDKIDLTDFGLSWGQVSAAMSESAGTTIIDLGGGDTLWLRGTAMTSLSASDFLLGGGSSSIVALEDTSWASLESTKPGDFGGYRLQRPDVDLWHGTDWNLL